MLIRTVFIWLVLGLSTARADVFNPITCSGPRASKQQIVYVFSPGSATSRTLPANYEIHLRGRVCNTLSGCSDWTDFTSSVPGAYQSSTKGLYFTILNSNGNTFVTAFAVDSNGSAGSFGSISAAKLNDPNEAFVPLSSMNASFFYARPSILSGIYPQMDWRPNGISFGYSSSQVTSSCIWIKSTMKSNGANTTSSWAEAEFIEYLTYQI